MQGNIVGSALDLATVQQLKLRQIIAAAGYKQDTGLIRTPQIINFLNNRNAWVKFASGVNIGGVHAAEKIKNIFEDTGITIDSDDPANLGLNGSNLARQFILFNGVSALDFNNNWEFRSGVANNNSFRNTFDSKALYGGIGQDRGLQPFPGIQSLKIKTLNRGSIRKATISLKCYNKLQFNIIEALYLRLGYNMLIEWGYDKYIARLPDADAASQQGGIAAGLASSGLGYQQKLVEDTKETFTESGFFESTTTNDDVYDAIDNYRLKYAGNYDGFYGKVQNFSWKINDDLSYDITVDLVTVGSLITSLKSNIPSSINSDLITDISQNLGNIVDLRQYEKDKRQEYLDEDSAKFIAPDIGTDAVSIYLNSKKVNFNSIKGEVDFLYVTEIIGDSGNVITSNSATTNTNIELISNRLYETISTGFQQARFNLEKTKTNRYFIRLGRFLDDYFDLVNLYINKTNADANKDQPLLNWLSTDDTYCNYSPDLIPFDIRVCYFKPKFSEITKENCFTTGVSAADKLEQDNIADFTTKVKGVILGQVNNIYMNIDFLLKELDKNVDSKGNLSVFTFVQNILNGINKAMANQTDLQLFVDNDKDVKILELNTPKGISKITPKSDFVFQAYGYGEDYTSASIIQNFNIKTKITPDLINLISIGAVDAGAATNGVKAISFNNFNKGLVNRFEPTYVQPPVELEAIDTETKQSTQDTVILAAFRDTFSNNLSKKKLQSGASGNNLANNDIKKQTGYSDAMYWGYTWGDGTAGRSSNDYRPEFSIFWNPPNSDTGNKPGRLKLTFKNNNIPGGYGIDDDGYNKYFLKWGKKLGDPEYWIGAAAGRWGPTIKSQVLKKTKKYLKSLNGTEVRQNLDPANYQEYLTEAFGGDFKYNVDVNETGTDTANVQQRSIGIGDAKWFEINPSFINSGKSLYKLNKAQQDVIDFKKNGVVSNSTGFIPIESSFDLDGLSTFQIFQRIKLSQKFLPNNYPSTLSFIIKNIDHDIKDNQWTTTLTTVSIPIQEQESAIKATDLDKKPFPEGGDTGEAADRSGCKYKPKAGLPTVAYDDSSISLLNPCSSTGLIIKSSVQPNKKIIVIHHTASNGSSASYVKGWIKKTYPIGTHYIIERNASAGKNGAVRLFEDKYWSNHIGKTPGEYSGGDPDEQEPYMLSIEVDNYGYLKKTSTGYKQGDKTWREGKISVDRPVRYKKNNTNINALRKQAARNVIKSFDELFAGSGGSTGSPIKSTKDLSVGKSGELYPYGISFPGGKSYLSYVKKTLLELGYVNAIIKGTGLTNKIRNFSATQFDLGMKKSGSGWNFGATEQGKLKGLSFINQSYVGRWMSKQFDGTTAKAESTVRYKDYTFDGRTYTMDGYSAWIIFSAVYAITGAVAKGKSWNSVKAKGNLGSYTDEASYNSLGQRTSNWEVFTYKGYSYFQKYTYKQVQATCKVVEDWAVKYKIPVCPTNPGTKVWNDWFESFFGVDKNGKGKVDTSAFVSDSRMAKATYTHNTYRKDKTDIYPSKQLIRGLIAVSRRLRDKGIIYPGDTSGGR
jgi:hypothetical protein